MSWFWNAKSVHFTSQESLLYIFVKIITCHFLVTGPLSQLLGRGHTDASLGLGSKAIAIPLIEKEKKWMFRDLYLGVKDTCSTFEGILRGPAVYLLKKIDVKLNSYFDPFLPLETYMLLIHPRNWLQPPPPLPPIYQCISLCVHVKSCTYWSLFLIREHCIWVVYKNGNKILIGNLFKAFNPSLWKCVGISIMLVVSPKLPCEFLKYRH